jgi:hypothetical protein
VKWVDSSIVSKRTTETFIRGSSGGWEISGSESFENPIKRRIDRAFSDWWMAIVRWIRKTCGDNLSEEKKKKKWRKWLRKEQWNI